MLVTVYHDFAYLLLLKRLIPQQQFVFLGMDHKPAFMLHRTDAFLVNAAIAYIDTILISREYESLQWENKSSFHLRSDEYVLVYEQGLRLGELHNS